MSHLKKIVRERKHPSLNRRYSCYAHRYEATSASLCCPCSKCVLGEEVLDHRLPAGSGADGRPSECYIGNFGGHLLLYAGAVASGFIEAVAAKLREKLDAIVPPAVRRRWTEITGRRLGHAGPLAQIAYHGARARRLHGRC